MRFLAAIVLCALSGCGEIFPAPVRHDGPVWNLDHARAVVMQCENEVRRTHEPSAIRQMNYATWELLRSQQSTGSMR